MYFVSPLLRVLIIKFKDTPLCLEQRSTSFISSLIYLKNYPVPLNNMQIRCNFDHKDLRHSDLCIVSPLFFFS